MPQPKSMVTVPSLLQVIHMQISVLLTVAVPYQPGTLNNGTEAMKVRSKDMPEREAQSSILVIVAVNVPDKVWPLQDEVTQQEVQDGSVTPPPKVSVKRRTNRHSARHIMDCVG